jgi:hypothetical protein
MRIVDRITFLAMPAGTLFAKFPPQPEAPAVMAIDFGELQIKDDTSSNDYWYVDTVPPPELAYDSADYLDAVAAAVLNLGTSMGVLDFETIQRDGLFDVDQLFAVFEREDVVRLVRRLQQALANAYGEEEAA